MCPCNRCSESPTRTGPRFRPVALLVQLLFAWVVLVLAGGTLKNFNHPVAIETGRLIQTVTFVEPAIQWTDERGFDAVASGLRLVAGGIPVHGLGHRGHGAATPGA